MPRPALLAPALLGLLAASLPGCGGSAEGGRADSLLQRGDYAGARRAADSGLQRAPRDQQLWRIKMRATLGAGDARGAVAQYRAWRDLRGDEDAEALRVLARTTVWQALRSRAPAIQSGAVQAVERLELDDLAPDIARLIASDEELVAAAAATALLTAHDQAPAVLVGLLRSDDPAVRALSVEGIGRKAGEHARVDLVPMLADRDPRVRSAAAAAVATFAEGEDLTRLITMARRDPEGRVRARVLRALAGRVGVDVARAAAGDPYMGARQAAVDLLARSDSAEAPAALDQLAASDDRDMALAAAAARLRRDAPPAAVLAVLERALASSSWPARAAALNAAHAAPRPLALSMSGRGIADPRPEVRLAAARLLLHLGQEQRARRELVSALAQPDALLRLDAAVDLCRLGDHRCLGPLDRLARSSSPEIRTAAVHAHVAARRITAGLVAALADTRPELRLVAAEVILGVVD
jgi:HEAT repeat protein